MESKRVKMTFVLIVVFFKILTQIVVFAALRTDISKPKDHRKKRENGEDCEPY